MGKKSAAQVRRLLKRAKARGEEYEIDDDTSNVLKQSAAAKLRNTLTQIDSEKDMNAKERRSAKRKAEAIAAEEAGCPASELLAWYEKRVKVEGKTSKKKNTEQGENDDDDDDRDKKKKRNHNPYIIFVGQLSYTTTKDGLFGHFQKALGPKRVTTETLRVRLLTDKTDKKNPKKSRGMAFVETSDPELLHECLKLHLTHLDGRRINVERSTGGGSTAKKDRIAQMRKEQSEYMSQTVEKILEEHRGRGDLDEDELDEGVVALCKRHSAATVEAALAEYVEARGRDMDNPSAYLTHMIGRIAVEGEASEKSKAKATFGRDGRRDNPRKRPKQSGEGGRGGGEPTLQNTSQFAKGGVDMSVSADPPREGSDMLKIFPSMNSRGRGRSRG